MASSVGRTLFYLSSLLVLPSIHHSSSTSATPQEYSAAPGGTTATEPEQTRGTPPTQRPITGSPAPAPALAAPDQSGGPVEGRTFGCLRTWSCWDEWWGKPSKPKPKPPPPRPPPCQSCPQPPCSGCSAGYVLSPIIVINNNNLNNQNHHDRSDINNINVNSLSGSNKCDSPTCSVGAGAAGAAGASAVPAAYPPAYPPAFPAAVPASRPGYSVGFVNGQAGLGPGGGPCTTCVQGKSLLAGLPESATAGHGEHTTPSAVDHSAGPRANADTDLSTSPHTALDPHPRPGTALPPAARESAAGSFPLPNHDAPHADTAPHATGVPHHEAHRSGVSSGSATVVHPDGFHLHLEATPRPVPVTGPLPLPLPDGQHPNIVTAQHALPRLSAVPSQVHIPGQTDVPEHVTEHVFRHASSRSKSLNAGG